MNDVKQDSVVNSNNKDQEPQFLYKYRTFDKYTERIFTHNEIYFPLPASFNDLSDSRVCLHYKGTRQERRGFILERLRKMCPSKSERELVFRAKKMMSGGEDIEVMERQLKRTANIAQKKLGVFSLTAKRDNLLMWVHYAKNHKGFCLEFDANDDFFIVAQRVTYNKCLPALNIIRSYTPLEYAGKLLTKAEDWKYEDEWRIVDHNQGSGIKHFPEKALTGVIIGCRTCQQNKDKIIRWCRKRKCRPILYEAREKRKEYGLKIVEVAY